MRESLLIILEYAREQIENSSHEILENVSLEQIEQLEEMANKFL